MSTPTQVQNSWRATARTVFAVLVGLLSIIPTILLTAGVDDTVIGAQVLAVTALVTKVLANPFVNSLIERFLPFLAAEPRG